MFGLFRKTRNRIEVKNSDVFIDNQKDNLGKATELRTVIEFKEAVPNIRIFENNKLFKTFKIDTLKDNPDLSGQYLHISIRTLQNSGVMIDGIISKSKTTFPEWTDSNYEAIRLQPFLLSDKKDQNLTFKGKGLFTRGLHFSGVVTPGGVRNICLCDSCDKSFTIQHFHSGFSQLQYFYSSDSKETLIVPYGAIENLPTQLENIIDENVIKSVEEKLPKPKNGNGSFKYYNPFRCPHCLTPYFDFENNKSIRPNEYYGNTYINCEPTRY